MADNCPLLVSKLSLEIMNNTNSHYRPHLESPLHHNLYYCKEYISNFRPLLPPQNPASGSAALDLTLITNWTPPDSADPFVAVCRLCWNELLNPSSLIGHLNGHGPKLEPGKMGKWQVLYNAFCVNLYTRRYPTVNQSQHQGDQATNLTRAELPINNHRSPDTEGQNACESYVPMSKHLALEEVIKTLTQQVATLHRTASSASSPRLNIPAAENTNGNDSMLQEEDGHTLDVPDCLILTAPSTSQNPTRDMVNEEPSQVAIDPDLQRRHSGADSGIGGSLSQSSSSRIGTSSPNPQLQRSLGNDVNPHAQQAALGNTLGGIQVAVERPVLDPDHLWDCRCLGCMAFYEYRNATQGIPNFQAGK
jgi:hypothetical protein